MNEKLQRIYYIIGILQRVSMVALTFGLIIAMGKVTLILSKLVTEVRAMNISIVSMNKTIESLRLLMDKSWFF